MEPSWRPCSHLSGLVLHRRLQWSLGRLSIVSGYILTPVALLDCLWTVRHLNSGIGDKYVKLAHFQVAPTGHLEHTFQILQPTCSAPLSWEPLHQHQRSKGTQIERSQYCQKIMHGRQGASHSLFKASLRLTSMQQSTFPGQMKLAEQEIIHVTNLTYSSQCRFSCSD